MDVSTLEAEAIKRLYFSADIQLLRSCHLHRELWCDESMLVIDCPHILIAMHLWDRQEAIAQGILNLGMSRKYVVRADGKVFRPVLSI